MSSIRILPIVKRWNEISHAEVLILRLSALGDVLNCLPALDALQELWPEARIDWIAESLGASVIEGHPGIRRVITLPRQRWRKLLSRPGKWPSLAVEAQSFATQLRRSHYDLVVDFQGNLRSTVVGMCCRARSRIGHHPAETKELAGRLSSRHPATPSGHVHRVEKNLHLLRALGWRGPPPPRGRLPSYREERAALAAETNLKDPPPVILHPFVSVFGRFKEWPAPYYAEVAELLAREGKRVVITWAPGEQAAAQQIVDAAHGAARLAPPTRSARELAALFTLARVVVAADTGPLHLAALAGVPVVGLYGPKDPLRYAPWTKRRRLLSASVPCSPCSLRHCDHAICMQAIHPERVARAVEELLEEVEGPEQRDVSAAWGTEARGT